MNSIKLFVKSLIYFILTATAFVCTTLIFEGLTSIDGMFLTLLVLPVLLWVFITAKILSNTNFQQISGGKIMTIVLALAVIVYMYFDGRNYDWDLGLDDLAFLGFGGLISLYFAFFKKGKLE